MQRQFCGLDWEGVSVPAVSEAAAKYDAVLSLLRQMNTSKDALSNVAGREKLVAQIRQIVSLEAKALDRMEEAIGAIR